MRTSEGFSGIPLPDTVGAEILRCEVGSTLHGTGLGPALEDHDELGVFLEWPRTTIGLDAVEQYVHRTAPEGVRSGPGDVDLVCYTARKWARLAMSGNPTVLLILFAPDDKIVVSTPPGEHLRANAQWFLSKRTGTAVLGYMESQRRKAANGDNWKSAMHMLRLGHQGVELLTNATITLPVPGDTGEHLRAVRRGEVAADEVWREADLLAERIQQLIDGESPLPDEPNRDAIEGWLITAHRELWARAQTP